MFRQFLFLSLIVLGSLGVAASNAPGDCRERLGALYQSAIETAGAMGLSTKKAEALLTGPERQHALDLIRTYRSVIKPGKNPVLETATQAMGKTGAISDQRRPIQRIGDWVRKLFGGNPPHFLDRNRYAILKMALQENDTHLAPAIQRWWLEAIKSFKQPPSHLSALPPIVHVREREYFKVHPMDSVLRSKVLKAAAAQNKIKIDPNLSRGHRRILERENKKSLIEIYDDQVLQSFIGVWAGETSRSMKSLDLWRAPDIREFMIQTAAATLGARGILDPDIHTYVANLLLYRTAGALPLQLTERQIRDRIRNVAVTELHELAEREAAGTKPVLHTREEEVFDEIRHVKQSTPAPQRTTPKIKTRGQPKTVVDAATVEIPDAKPQTPAPLTFPLVNVNGTHVFEKDTELLHFIETGDPVNASWSRYAPLVAEKFAMLSGITRYEDLKLKFPSFEKYTERWQAYYGYKSVRIDSQFRFIFHWDGERIVNLVIDDYHGGQRAKFRLPPVEGQR